MHTLYIILPMLQGIEEHSHTHTQTHAQSKVERGERNLGRNMEERHIISKNCSTAIKTG